MSSSVRSANTSDRNEYFAQIREAASSPSPVEDIMSDPSLMRALVRPRRNSSSSRKSSKTEKSSRRDRPDVEFPFLNLALAEENHKSSQLKSLLRSTADRLEYEMRRADAAERRAEYAEARTKQLNDRLANLTRVQHQTELTLTRATEEAKRSKMMLDNTESELQRAEQDIDDLEIQIARAESEARQAREVSRQCERALHEREAKEMGRQEALAQLANRYVEGIEAGRKEGYNVAKKQERSKREKIYVEAFEAGRTEGYGDGKREGRAQERKNALDAFDEFLEHEGYTDDSGSRGPN